MNRFSPTTSLCRLALAIGLGVLALGAGAQQLGDLEKKSALSDAERAKRDADKVFQWIKFNADKAPAKPAAPAPAPAKPVAKAAPRHEAPAPSRKVEEAQTQPEPALASAASSSPAPEPVQLAAASPTLNPPPPAAIAPAPEPETEVALQLVSKVEPEIPRQLLSSVRSGLVVVKFTVEPNGAVSGAEATKSSHRKLAVAAIDAVNQWRFAPIPKAREVSVEIGFQAE
ncbi:TonB family protein [Paucibacter soli]|uniref:TonB family protein n=1 Tax=Paucibacter soli TaxID=3133433 RepID=UPI00309637B5